MVQGKRSNQRGSSNGATCATFSVERKLYLLLGMRFTLIFSRQGSDSLRRVVGSESSLRSGEGKSEQVHSLPPYHSLPSTLKFLRSLAIC